jgi:hypothetical protein
MSSNFKGITQGATRFGEIRGKSRNLIVVPRNPLRRLSWLYSLFGLSLLLRPDYYASNEDDYGNYQDHPTYGRHLLSPFLILQPLSRVGIPKALSLDTTTVSV